MFRLKYLHIKIVAEEQSLGEVFSGTIHTMICLQINFNRTNFQDVILIQSNIIVLLNYNKNNYTSCNNCMIKLLLLMILH